MYTLSSKTVFFVAGKSWESCTLNWTVLSSTLNIWSAISPYFWQTHVWMMVYQCFYQDTVNWFMINDLSWFQCYCIDDIECIWNSNIITWFEFQTIIIDCVGQTADSLLLDSDSVARLSVWWNSIWNCTNRLISNNMSIVHNNIISGLWFSIYHYTNPVNMLIVGL